MKAIFTAQIKEVKVKELVSGDKSVRITLDVQHMDLETKKKLMELSATEQNTAFETIIGISDGRDEN